MAIILTLEKSVGFDENGKEKTEKKMYIAPSPKARIVRNALAMTEIIDTKNMKTADVDSLMNYIVDLFGRQFTIDDIYDGLDADKIQSTLLECVGGIVGTMGAKLEQFPNATETGK
jgi:hypothetical protein